MLDFNQYIKELQSVPIDEITEHSKRFALETLLKDLASGYAATNSKIKVLHEPRRKDSFGSPDFKIYTDNSIIGYVENKKISENLDKILKSKQIVKYRELSQNILLTNYIDFVWIKGDMIQRETLCYLSDIENKKFKVDDEKSLKVEQLIVNFYSQPPIGIANAKDLALALAIRGKNLKDFLNDDLDKFKEDDENNDDFLFGLYKTFKSYVFKQLTISDFSDAFAQMLVYGLFLAKLNADTKIVTLENAKSFIPQSFQLIKELVSFLDKLDNPDYSDTKWIIDETISIMNNLDLPELKKSLLFSKKVKDNENIDTDPYIYFYETFLAAYDSKLRKAKGVYYTPPQVVNFIIRTINDILKTVFKINSGFADPNNVTVLDFATGTGTFIIEILKQIFDTLPPNSNALKDMLIKDHILKNIYGFEYLIAPYTIAHLKLSQYLNENGYKLTDQHRFQIFLTNTLEPIADIPPNIFVKTLSKEGKLAQQVKDKPILVITGNPPYSGHSKNTGDWITNLLKGNDIWATEKSNYQANYFEVDGKPLGERNSKWLQDDYVKFIRFAQYKIDRAGEGVVGIITNHSFLDNPTFRGMRQSLMKSFDQLYFIDLHGNNKKKEKAPDGEKDQNVFDIEQGVSISIMVKKKGLEKKIYHTDFWGTRKQKFEQCLNNSLENIDFVEIKPNSPFYFFIPQNQKLRKQYEIFWNVRNIFKISSVGIVTARDEFTIKNSETEVWETINDFITLDERTARDKFKLGEDSRDWKVVLAKEDIISSGLDKNKIMKIAYRPFDIKYTYFTGKSRGIHCMPRGEIMFNMQRKNIALQTCRQVSSGNFQHIFISEFINESCLVSNRTKEITYAFPLYIYEKQSHNLFKKEQPQKQLSKYEEEFNEHSKLFEQAKFELNRHIEKLNTEQNPTDEDLEILEEHKSTFEEFRTSYEQIKEHYKQLIGNSQNEIKEFESQNIEYLENGLIRRPNFSKEFIEFFKKQYSINFTPEQILGYFYAILHSPTYRIKYSEFLKIDFPRIPFCESEEQFINISNLGWLLIQSHLLENIPSGKDYDNLCQFKGDGDNTVLKPEFKSIKTDEGFRDLLFINKTQFFENVPENVFNYYIGGYQVLDKYLKDRKNKKLVLNEIINICKTVKVIAFTIKQMELIDNETVDWI